MQLLSNAKINLGLSILNKRNDGYHDIESIFIPIPWHDTIRLSESKELAFQSKGITIDSDFENNLCIKAYRLLEQKYQLPPVKIELEKNIPIGAGLGGGSSNAAFVLKGLNELFQLGIEESQLEKYAGSLGSDCTFFIKNKTAFVEGKGEIMDHSIQLNLNAHCLVVYPGTHISTKEAYAGISPTIPEKRLRNAVSLPKSIWTETIKNDFEKSILPKYPQLQQLKNQLEKMGAFYVSMSGSGSSVFALFESQPDNVLIDKSYQWKLFQINS